MYNVKTLIFSISLKTKSNPRNVKVAKIIIPTTEKPMKKEPEPPKKTNIFGAAQSKSAQSKSKSNQTNVEKNDSGSEDVKVKQETSSPKKQSPKKQAPAKQNKSSIASFFGSKPSTSNASKTNKSVSEATKKIESVKIKEEVNDTAPSDAKSSQKRPLPTSGKLTESLCLLKT